MTKNLPNKKANLLLDWLNKPYYFKKKNSYKFFFSLLMGLIVTLFLILFKPYNIEKLVTDIDVYAIYCGTTVAFSLLIFYFFFINLFPSFFKHNLWTREKQIIAVLCTFLIVNNNVWVLNNYIVNYLFKIKLSFFNITKYVFSIGIFPLVIYFFISERYNKYLKSKRKK